MYSMLSWEGKLLSHKYTNRENTKPAREEELSPFMIDNVLRCPDVLIFVSTHPVNSTTQKSPSLATGPVPSLSTMNFTPPGVVKTVPSICQTFHAKIESNPRQRENKTNTARRIANNQTMLELRTCGEDGLQTPRLPTG